MPLLAAALAVVALAGIAWALRDEAPLPSPEPFDDRDPIRGFAEPSRAAPAASAPLDGAEGPSLAERAGRLPAEFGERVSSVVAGAFPFADGGSDRGSVSGATPEPDAGLLGTLGVNQVKKWTPPAAAAPYLATINEAAQKHAIPDGLLERQIYQESRYRDDIISGRTRSSAGATGIAQFMPRTAQALGIDPLNPTESINAMAKEMRRLFDATGSWVKALAAYNWGQGNLARKGLAAAPTETKNYIAQITADVPNLT
jgi:hypothetical protein